MEGLPVIREESAVVGSVLILQATQSTPTFAHILLCLLDMKRNNVVDHHTLLGHWSLIRPERSAFSVLLCTTHKSLGRGSKPPFARSSAGGTQTFAFLI